MTCVPVWESRGPFMAWGWGQYCCWTFVPPDESHTGLGSHEGGWVSASALGDQIPSSCLSLCRGPAEGGLHLRRDRACPLGTPAE